MRPDMRGSVKKSGKKVFLTTIICTGLFVALVFIGFKKLVSSISDKFDRSEIFQENIATNEVKRLTIGGRNQWPCVSSDGNKIAYVHKTDGSVNNHHSELKVLSLDEDETISILENSSMIRCPSWQKSGEYIYYLSETDGQEDIWKVFLKNRQTEKVTDDRDKERDAQISPDGKWVLFTQKDENGKKQIYIISSNGGKKIKLTNIESFMNEPQDPAWSPDSMKIVYIDLLSLVVIDLDGKILYTEDFRGISNLHDPIFNPVNMDIIMFRARMASDLSLESDLFVYSFKEKSIEKYRKVGMMEFQHVFSPDGEKLYFSKPYKIDQ